MLKILFVCAGNTCRSVMAQFILKQLALSQTVRPCEIRSAGLSVKSGSPMSEAACRTLSAHGIPFDPHTAVPFCGTHYDWADLIFVMERQMAAQCGGDPQHKIRCLLDLTDSPYDIADPYCTGDYETAYDEIARGCKALVAWLGTDVLRLP